MALLSYIHWYHLQKSDHIFPTQNIDTPFNLSCQSDLPPGLLHALRLPREQRRQNAAVRLRVKAAYELVLLFPPPNIHPLEHLRSKLPIGLTHH